MKNYPAISIVTPTWNSPLPLFERVLKEIKQQDYPKRLVEHIVMDAGSTNSTAELAKKYGCKVTVRKDLQIQEQVRASLGIKRAHNNIILMLQSDNIPTSQKWLQELVQPFMDNKKVFCTYSAYNSYEKGMSATTRYGAFFGAADPLLYYIGKSDKMPLLSKTYDKGEIIADKRGYWIVKFDKTSLPTLGDNGHMFLKSAISKVIKDPKGYIHPDAFAQLLELGYNTCGVVKNSVIHIIPPDITRYAIRRVHVKDKYYDKKRGKRKYLVVDWQSKKDIFNVLKFVIYSLTIVAPLTESIRGYIKIRDTAWFLHPILCVLMTISYGTSELMWHTRKLFLFADKHDRRTKP